MKPLLRLFGRIALILAAAALVVGIAMLFQPASPAFGAEGRPALGQPPASGGAGMGRGHGAEAGGLNLQGGAEVLGNTLRVTLIMVPFAAWSIVARRRRNSQVRMRNAELHARQ